MANSYSIGNVFGIPIRVHVTLLIFLPLFAFSFMPVDGPLGLFYGALGAVGLFASVALHEIGHSLVARAKGSRILEILLLPFAGLAKLDRLPPRPADEIQTALAGPAVSLVLGLAGLFLAPLIYPFNPPLAVLAHELGRINVMLVLFNLIPSFPMDGGRVFRAALAPRLGRLPATRIATAVGRGFAWIFGIWAFRPMLDGGPINFFLLFIAYFVHQSAGAEARLAEAEAAFGQPRAQPGGIRQIPAADVRVGPPPYARDDSRAASKGLFDDLLDKWR